MHGKCAINHFISKSGELFKFISVELATITMNEDWIQITVSWKRGNLATAKPDVETELIDIFHVKHKASHK